VRALTDLAFALWLRVAFLWSDDPAGDLARAEKAVDAALALQPDYTWPHFLKGEIYYKKGQPGPSIAEYETAIALNPNNADAHANAGYRKMLGRAEDGFAGVETAFRLSPRDTSLPYWQFYMCGLHAYLAQWEQAIPWCEKSITAQPQVYIPYVYLAAANAWAGRDKEAKDAAAQLQKVSPGFTMQTWAGLRASDDPTYIAQRARVAEGLRKAGVPEGEKKTD
jgi:tetratricopeptide (TPR) repeat protein